MCDVLHPAISVSVLASPSRTARQGKEPWLHTSSSLNLVCTISHLSQLPSTTSQGGEGVIFDALQILAGQRRAHVVGSCQGLAPGAPATTAELQRLLAAPASGDVVVVCAGEEAEQPALLNEVVRLSAESQPLMLVVELPAGEVAAQVTGNGVERGVW